MVSTLAAYLVFALITTHAAAIEGRNHDLYDTDDRDSRFFEQLMAESAFEEQEYERARVERQLRKVPSGRTVHQGDEQLLPSTDVKFPQLDSGDPPPPAPPPLRPRSRPRQLPKSAGGGGGGGDDDKGRAQYAQWLADTLAPLFSVARFLDKISGLGAYAQAMRHTLLMHPFITTVAWGLSIITTGWLMFYFCCPCCCRSNNTNNKN